MYKVGLGGRDGRGSSGGCVKECVSRVGGSCGDKRFRGEYYTVEVFVRFYEKVDSWLVSRVSFL